jgi:hypothetical protein
VVGCGVLEIGTKCVQYSSKTLISTEPRTSHHLRGQVQTGKTYGASSYREAVLLDLFIMCEYNNAPRRASQRSEVGATRTHSASFIEGAATTFSGAPGLL